MNETAKDYIKMLIMITFIWVIISVFIFFIFGFTERIIGASIIAYLIAVACMFFAKLVMVFMEWIDNLF